MRNILSNFCKAYMYKTETENDSNNKIVEILRSLFEARQSWFMKGKPKCIKMENATPWLTVIDGCSKPSKTILYLTPMFPSYIQRTKTLPIKLTHYMCKLYNGMNIRNAVERRPAINLFSSSYFLHVHDHGFSIPFRCRCHCHCYWSWSRWSLMGWLYGCNAYILCECTMKMNVFETTAFGACYSSIIGIYNKPTLKRSRRCVIPCIMRYRPYSRWWQATFHPNALVSCN